MTDNLSVFISRAFEKEINKNMLYYNYDFPYEIVKDYVDKILSIPVDALVNQAIISPTLMAIEAKDVFQFSDFDAGSIRICTKLINVGNPGVTYLEAGKLLLDDGISRKEGAYTKYGENHLKLSESLGLTHELTRTYFISCIGMIYPDLSEENQKRLLTRLLLRNKFVIRLIKAADKGNVNLRQFLYMLSESTYVRRRSNVKYILNILKMSDEYDFNYIINNITL